jgi:hypothetical protein
LPEGAVVDSNPTFLGGTVGRPLTAAAHQPGKYRTQPAGWDHEELSSETLLYSPLLPLD